MRRPHGGHVIGASPQIPFADDLSARQGDLICPQDQLLDLRMIQSWYQSGALKGGLWLPNDQSLFQDGLGTVPQASGSVISHWDDCSLDQMLTSDIATGLKVAGGSWIPYGNNTVAQDGDAVKITYVDNLSGAYCYFRQTAYNSTSRALLQGERVRFSCEIKINSGEASARINYDGTNSVVNSFTNTSYVSISIDFTNLSPFVASNPYIRIQFASGSGQIVWMRNIKLVPIGGNNGVQTTTANKPLTAITPITRKPWMTADNTDVLPVVFPASLGSACTIARATPTGVTFDEAQTISATWNNLIQPYQYNSAVLVADRQLTAREKAIVSRVLGAYVPALSNELISNGSFDTDLSGWMFTNLTGGATIVWEAGRAHVVSPVGVGWTALKETILRAGGYYLVKATLEISSGVVGFNMGSSDPQIGSRVMTTSGSYSTVLGRTGGDNYFYLTKYSNSALLDCYWDNASVREVI